MKVLLKEALLAVLIVFFVAGTLDTMWWLTALMGHGRPIDKIFIAAAGICYFFFRVSKNKEFEQMNQQG